MVDLQRSGVAHQIGAAEVTGRDVAVRVLDLPGLYLIPCGQPPNTRLGEGPYTLWLAPDRALQVGGAPPSGFVSDITDGQAVFEISGPAASGLLAMGTSFAPPPDGCGQTLFAGVRVLVYRFGDALRLHAERPLAAYLLQWFQTAVTAL